MKTTTKNDNDYDDNDTNVYENDDYSHDNDDDRTGANKYSSVTIASVINVFRNTLCSISVYVLRVFWSVLYL